MVEAAIVLPVVLVFLFGIIDFSWAMNDWNSVRQGSREGARAGSVYNSGGDKTCALQGASANTATHELVCLTKDRVQLTEADTRVKIVFPDGHEYGESIVVCVQYPVNSVTGMFDLILNGKTVNSKVEMRLDDVGESGDPAFVNVEETAITDWGFCS